MSIHKELEAIFAGEQVVTEEEQEVIEDAMCFLREDVENEEGGVLDLDNKILGIIEFLEACGKISEDQGNRLRLMLGKILSGEEP